MKLIVKKLKLFQALNFSVQNPKDDDFSDKYDEELITFEDKVPENSTEPDKKDFLTNRTYLGAGFKTEENDIKPNGENSKSETINSIPSGDYFFIQGFLSKEDSSNKDKIRELLEQEAEEVFLEALWQEVKFQDRCIYIRKLKEGDATVFQLFRKIKI